MSVSQTFAMEKPLEDAIAQKIETYPVTVRDGLLFLRQLVLETAAESDQTAEVEETLKWGQPSYRTKNGSAIRIDWKSETADHIAMYFHCQSKLVSTFKAIYPDEFTFEGNRAIVFENVSDIPVDALKHCISMALSYHKVKHLPLLGA